MLLLLLGHDVRRRLVGCKDVLGEVPIKPPEERKRDRIQKTRDFYMIRAPSGL